MDVVTTRRAGLLGHAGARPAATFALLVAFLVPGAPPPLAPSSSSRQRCECGCAERPDEACCCRPACGSSLLEPCISDGCQAPPPSRAGVNPEVREALLPPEGGRAAALYPEPLEPSLAIRGEAYVPDAPEHVPLFPS